MRGDQLLVVLRMAYFTHILTASVCRFLEVAALSGSLRVHQL
jgi:hypothetical protein